MWKYAEFYCKQDVNILKQAFMIFRHEFIEAFNLDVFNHTTISAIAYEVFKVNLFYPNGNLFEIGGIVRLFCAKAIHGGRCMCAFNKKWDIPLNLSDFDAISLYPSAMSRLYTVEGQPKVITEFDYARLTKIATVFIVEIVIFKAHKHYAFPLIVQKTKKNEIRYDDHFDEPVTMVVDDIYL
jgi:hypothetical protein